MATQKISSRQVKSTPVWEPFQYPPAWGDYGGAEWAKGEYTKIAGGMVVLKGLVKNISPGTTPEHSVVCILPVGYRPAVKIRVAVAMDLTSNLPHQRFADIAPDGKVTIGATLQSSYWVSFGGVSFLAEQ